MESTKTLLFYPKMGQKIVVFGGLAPGVQRADIPDFTPLNPKWPRILPFWA